MAWFEAGTIDHHSGATWSYGITVTSVGFSSPAVSASRAWDITDPDNPADATGTVLSGNASISTTSWTTPLITATTAGGRYRIETDVTDGGKTGVLVLFINCPY